LDALDAGRNAAAMGNLLAMYSKVTTADHKKDLHACLALMTLSGTAFYRMSEPLQLKFRELARSSGYPLSSMVFDSKQQAKAATLIRLATASIPEENEKTKKKLDALVQMNYSNPTLK
jgi:hypothetical protein